MKIGWFTPYNPRSGIGHYSESALRGLARSAEVTVFASDVGSPEEARPCALPLVCLKGRSDGADLGRFDLLVYNLGDHAPYHARVFDAACRRPGLVILHDVVVRHFFQMYFLRREGGQDALKRCMAFCHGADSVPRQLQLYAALPIPTRAEEYFRFSMFPAAIHRALGVLVHSEFGLQRVGPATDAPVRKIDFPIFGPAERYVDLVPQRRNGDGPIRFLTFGVLNPNKLVHTVIAAIGTDPYLRRNLVYTVIGVGEPHYTGWLRVLIERFGLKDRVHLLGYRDDDELRREMAASDVIINLRNPHLGESSGVLLNSLVAGLPTVVWDHGFYGEFPDDVVCKVSSELELPAALVQLCQNPEERRRMGERARAHALERFDTETYCRRFLAFAEEVRGRRPLHELYDRVSDLMLEMGVSRDDRLSDQLAREIAVLAPGPGAPPGAVQVTSRPKQNRAA